MTQSYEVPFTPGEVITPQKAYNRMRKYFMQPDAQLSRIPAAISEHRACLYRWGDPDNGVRKCAAGCLLPDSMYDENRMEGKDFNYVYASLSDEAMTEWPLTRTTRDFVQYAQKRHDGSETVAEFIYKLDALADNYKLALSANARTNLLYS